MKYHITIKPKPYTMIVESLSGPDVAEEEARRRFLIDIFVGKINIHDADHSEVDIQEEK
jgi:hypothetical protein